VTASLIINQAESSYLSDTAQTVGYKTTRRERQTDRQTADKTDRQTDRPTDSSQDRQTDNRQDRQTADKTDRQRKCTDSPSVIISQSTTPNDHLQ